MTIIFINSIGKKKWGGGEKWIINTAIGLQKLGHDVTIGARKNSILVQKANKAGLKSITVSYKTDFAVLSALKLSSYYKKNNTQIVIGSQNRDIRIAGFASKLLKKGPKVIGRQGVQLIRKKWKYRFTFTKLSDGILTNSYSLKNVYDSFGWWDENFVKMIYNGIHFNHSDTAPFNYEEIAPIGPNTKVILSAGRLDAQKGFCYLIEAAKYAKKNNKDWKFFVAGTGKLYPKLMKLIAEYELEESVFLLGFIPDIHSLLKSAHVFVLPSLYEGMPNVLLEAMLRSTPIITTPVNGSSELIEDGKTGLFVPIKDPEAIFEKLDFLLNHPEKAKEMAEKAHLHIKNNFDIQQSIYSVEKYLHSKLNKDEVLH
jgi:glycosyltransferase involved in cell wall biosynthesis